ncbi:MAG: deoxyribose-phosphate aldolase [Verrucomicrobiales bacterium]
MTQLISEPLSRYLDAAILKPETTQAEFDQALEQCVALDTRTVCVRPCDIKPAQHLCRGTDTGVCVVLGFPHGVILPESKSDEAKRYLDFGVDEIDMVVNYSWARSDLWDKVLLDIQAVSQHTRPAQVPLKVIFESSQLDATTVAKLVDLSIEAQADFVKTSTGFTGEGATDEMVQLMLQQADGRIKVKPSGGIRDQARATALLEMGAHRLGVNWASCQAIVSGDGGGGSGY